MKKLFLGVLFLGLVSCGGDESSSGVEGAGNGVQGFDWFRSEVEFVKIPAGWFMMGSPENELNRGTNENGEDGKRVRVEISKPFEMMSHEMTQALYERVMEKNPSFFKRKVDCGNWDSVKEMCPDNPVENVSWEATQDFIKRLNASLGLNGCEGSPQDPKGCYRLPTEAEWEYAVRAGSETAYFYGRDPSQLGRYAIYFKNSGERTHRVKGDRLSNRYGLYDVYGNVWEWVQDKWQDYLPGGKDPLVTDVGGWFSGSYRVLRGGGWIHDAEYLRSADRYWLPPGLRDNGIGFRLVRTL